LYATSRCVTVIWGWDGGRLRSSRRPVDDWCPKRRAATTSGEARRMPEASEDGSGEFTPSRPARSGRRDDRPTDRPPPLPPGPASIVLALLLASRSRGSPTGRGPTTWWLEERRPSDRHGRGRRRASRPRADGRLPVRMRIARAPRWSGGAPRASLAPAPLTPRSDASRSRRASGGCSGARARFGTRHLLTLVTEEGGVRGWRLEERISIFPAPRLPGVLVQRIEDPTEDFRPRFLHYRERCEGDGTGGTSPPYEVLRTGPVRELMWDVTEQSGDRSTAARVPLPEQARGPLGAREFVTRARPRRAGLDEMPIVDAATGAVRVVRAGFVSLGVGGTTRREDLLRIEDGDRTLESRWVQGDPPRCILEDVSPGRRAERNAAQVARAGPSRARPVPVPRRPGGGRRGRRCARPWSRRPLRFAPPGVVARRPPPLARRAAVARASAARRRSASSTTPPPPPAPPPPGPSRRPLQTSRPRPRARGRTEVAGVPSLADAAGRHVAGRGSAPWSFGRPGGAVPFVSCPETAWPDAHDALESIVRSFRWL
jgi:hypothetical protein